MGYTITPEFAADYDRYCLEHDWYGPEMLFGLCSEFLKPGEWLLDVGIGTGMSSEPFKRAGLRIWGIDGSEEMLKICRVKRIAEDLRCLDITRDEIRRTGDSFDHVIANGLFHLTGDLGRPFQGISRSLKHGGTFAFTVDAPKAEGAADYRETATAGMWKKVDGDSGIVSFRHSESHVMKMLRKYRFELLKKTEFMAFRHFEIGRFIYFAAYVCRRENDDG